MAGSPFARARNLVASARILSRLDPEAREALRIVAEGVADENVRARRSPTIHPTAVISPFASIRFAERVEVGPGASLGPYSIVWGGWSRTWARVGRDVALAPAAVLVAGNHAVHEPGTIREMGMDEADVIVEEGTIVSANAIVIGCRVGRYAMVGANAVVTHDVPDYAIVAGVPARVIGRRPQR